MTNGRVSTSAMISIAYGYDAALRHDDLVALVERSLVKGVQVMKPITIAILTMCPFRSFISSKHLNSCLVNCVQLLTYPVGFPERNSKD